MNTRAFHDGSKKKLVFKPIYIVVLAGVLIVVLMILASNLVFSNDGAPAEALPAEISIEKAFAMREAGAFILDVRTVEEWNDFHVPDSALIPVGQLEQRVSEVPNNRDVVVVCRSGNRSRTGRDILLKAGLSRVTSMTGGLKQWQAAGYPTVSGP